MKPAFILVLFLLGWGSAVAQAPLLYFEKLSVQHGLSHNKVNCILQDQRGFMWMGTDDGLNRYDGKYFTRFQHNPYDTASISGNIITDLLEDSEGVLWIATADGGLSRYNHKLPPQEQFKQFRHRPGDQRSIPVNIINAIEEDKLGYLWLASSGRSMIRFHKKTETFEAVFPKGTKTVLALATDKNGIIWAGRQGGGLLQIDPVRFSFYEDERYRNLYAGLPHAAVTAVYPDGDNNLWLGSWDKVLYKQQPASGKEWVYQAQGAFTFSNDEVLCFAADNNQRIWMGGSSKGLQVYDRATGFFYQYQYDPSKEGAIADNRVNCIYKDREGNMWLGTNKGVCISNRYKQQFAQRFLPGGSLQAPITVYDFFEEADGTVLMGTSHGIYELATNGSLQHIPLSYGNKKLQVTAFCRNPDGGLFLGTDYSLFVYKPGSRELSLLPNTEQDGVMKKIIDSRIVSIVRTKLAGEDVLLVAPYGHYLAYYSFTRKKWISRLDSAENILARFNLTDNLIRKFYPAKNGDLWVATAKSGLGQWPAARGQAVRFLSNQPGIKGSLTNNNIYDLAEDAAGNLWVSTYGGGLHYLNVQQGRFQQVAATTNLVEGVNTDAYGNVWMISNGHLHQYDPRRRFYSSYQLPDLEESGGVKGKLFKDSKGFLYIAGAGYFIRFHPDSVHRSYREPNVVLTGFSIFNNAQSHLLQQRRVELSYRQNYFTFEFSAPHFVSGSNVQYAYMLEGFDKTWMDAGERNYVAYSNLPGGDYVFKVRATATPGVWRNNYAAVQLRIIPPYWKRPWFFVLCAIALGALIYFLYRYRINELLKRQAIRNKIAQDLHDNVGSTLSSISVYSQVAKIYHRQQKESALQQTLEKIGTASGEMISELNDTVWAINPRNDNMQVILERMDSFARPLLAAQGVQFHFEHDDFAEVNLGMEQRKNFYLIFKEVVNNTLKYADCKNFNAAIWLKGHHIEAVFADDGKGFDLTKTSEGYKSSDVYGGGNGLKNLQMRSREMKGKLTIASLPGRGTSVTLLFPIT